MIKHYKHLSNSSFNVKKVSRKHLWKGRPEKSLCEPLKKNCGRNNLGRMTVKKSTRHKRLYRRIDFNIAPGAYKVIRLEYDPNRTAFVTLVKNEEDKLSYHLAVDKLEIGQKIYCGNDVDIVPGNRTSLINIPVKTDICNLEIEPNDGGTIIRSAGTFGRIINKENGYALIELPSKEQRLFKLECKATIGVVSNLQNNLEKEGKAGRNRWKGRKPITKGGCKNPVDHHNGGRNRSRVLASENGRVILGKKTRSKTKYSNKSIFQNRKGIKFNKKTTTKREKK